jgi:hydrogenase maturation protein HypF
MTDTTLRLHIRVRGQVQGVGFRPFVYRLARELALAGWVRNDAQGVEVEVQGSREAVHQFLARLRSDAPALARVAAVQAQQVPPREESTAFAIAESRGGPVATAVTPDAAICADCLAELFDPRNRRYRYPFINCTQCGPRYTITRALPYDRPQTSMAEFEQCPACQAEYDDPASRRFHAQPNACPACGPRVWLTDSAGDPERSDDVPADMVARLKRGEVLAVKGLGGFHLACDARSYKAVARLRTSKQREEKPFAVMLANAASIQPFAYVGADERRLLESPERPIVLLRKREGCDRLLPGVAPGLAWLGVVLPYTPLHYLIFHAAAGAPPGHAWLDEPQPLTLVMTSANPGGEPLVIDNDEALRRLAGIADGYVMYDRKIVTRVDDSVVRSEAPAVASHDLPLTPYQFIRRARGFTPQAIRLAQAGPPVLALGGHLKNTICLTRHDEAFVSQHIGDLDNAATCSFLEETVARLMELLRIEPEIVARDLHPDFFSSRYAARFASQRGLPLVAVQHHHAHIAAVAAEHGVQGPLLGLALDGVGLGADGRTWGGELLRVDGPGFVRLGHLRELPLPGGDRAAREPWRMAAAALYLLERSDEIETRCRNPAAPTVRQMLVQGFNAPPTSSCGRWFDAAAGLLGVKNTAAYEGQAAMLLEGHAEAFGPLRPLAGGFIIRDDLTLDLAPLIAQLVGERDMGYGAALFHATLVEALFQWTLRAADREGLDLVAFGGGCFLNHILSRGLRQRLHSAGMQVLEARQVPPGDGGLSLGQAWIAMRGEA